MKGQLTLEYMISFGIFIGVISFIYMSYIGNIPKFVDEVEKESIRSETYQISELLINDPGEPPNWNLGNVKRIGLQNQVQNKQNLIDRAKINILYNCATQYQDFKNKIGTTRDFSLAIFDINTVNGGRTLLYSCSPPQIIKTTVNATVKRIIAYTDGAQIKLAELIVQV